MYMVDAGAYKGSGRGKDKTCGGCSHMDLSFGTAAKGG